MFLNCAEAEALDRVGPFNGIWELYSWTQLGIVMLQVVPLFLLGRHPFDTSAHGFPVLLEPLHRSSRYWWQTFRSCRERKFLGRSTVDL